MKYLLTFWLMAMLLPVAAMAAQWQIKPEQSHIRFSGTHAGSEFTGRFSQFSGDIRFNPHQLDESRVMITVDLTSAVTGDTTYDKTLPQSDWLNSKNNPRATYLVETFVPLEKGDDRYRVEGILSMRGHSVPVTLDASIAIEGERAEVYATTMLNRMDFHIGKASDPTGEWVSLKIPLEIKLIAKKQ